MLRFLTAGESHGKGLVVILEGMPAGLRLDFDAITEQLKRRQSGYGRGRRMVIKSDRTDIRDVLERASARETAARVAAGAIVRQLLGKFDVEIVSHVYRVN